MLVIPLQSGSNGNCTYVEAAGARLLFDAGISGRQAEGRLAGFDRSIRRVDGPKHLPVGARLASAKGVEDEHGAEAEPGQRQEGQRTVHPASRTRV